MQVDTVRHHAGGRVLERHLDGIADAHAEHGAGDGAEGPVGAGPGGRKRDHGPLTGVGRDEGDAVGDGRVHLGGETGGQVVGRAQDAHVACNQTCDRPVMDRHALVDEGQPPWAATRGDQRRRAQFKLAGGDRVIERPGRRGVGRGRRRGRRLAEGGVCGIPGGSQDHGRQAQAQRDRRKKVVPPCSLRPGLLWPWTYRPGDGCSPALHAHHRRGRGRARKAEGLEGGRLFGLFWIGPVTLNHMAERADEATRRP